MNLSIPRAFFATIAGTLILSGCETVAPLIARKPVQVASRPAPVAPARPAPGTAGNPSQAPQAVGEQQALRDGIELYNKGSFSEAIKRLASPEIANGSRATQVQAHKYLAFSYCVSSRQTLCRQNFEKAFKLDPGFDLQPGEHGHPLWGPMFARAKKSAR